MWCGPGCWPGRGATPRYCGAPVKRRPCGGCGSATGFVRRSATERGRVALCVTARLRPLHRSGARWRVSSPPKPPSNGPALSPGPLPDLRPSAGRTDGGPQSAFNVVLVQRRSADGLPGGDVIEGGADVGEGPTASPRPTQPVQRQLQFAVALHPLIARGDTGFPVDDLDAVFVVKYRIDSAADEGAPHRDLQIDLDRHRLPPCPVGVAEAFLHGAQGGVVKWREIRAVVAEVSAGVLIELQQAGACVELLDPGVEPVAELSPGAGRLRNWAATVHREALRITGEPDGRGRGEVVAETDFRHRTTRGLPFSQEQLRIPPPPVGDR